MLERTVEVGDDGKIADPRDRELVAYMFRAFAGRRVRVMVALPRRSDNAVAWYWLGILKPIADALRAAGVKTNEQTLHAEFKRRYLSPRVVTTSAGRERVAPPSTEHLDMAEFAAYCAAIMADELAVASGADFERLETWAARRGQRGLTGPVREPKF